MTTTRRDFLKISLLALVGVSVAKPVKPSVPAGRYVAPGMYTYKIKDIKVCDTSVWADLCADAEFCPMFDPVTKYDIIMRECGHPVTTTLAHHSDTVHKIDMSSFNDYYYQEDKVTFYR
jgi:hypothetical protein